MSTCEERVAALEGALRYQANRVCAAFGKMTPRNHCETHWSEWPMAADVCEWRQAARAALTPPAPAAPMLHPDDGHAHRFGCRLCGVDQPGAPVTEERIEMPDGKCPLCWSSATFRLPPDWQDRVNRDQSIPVVGCGNSWHYIDGAGMGAPTEPPVASTGPGTNEAAGPVAPAASGERAKERHADHAGIEPDAYGFDFWCIAPCHDGGMCDGECHPDCERCPEPCALCQPAEPDE